MIIPIGHDQTIRRWPWVTIGIIVLCTLMQVYSSFGAPSEEEVTQRALVLAAKYQANPTPEQAIEVERELRVLADEIPEMRWGYRTGTGLTPKIFTSAFVHAGWFHLIGNMLFLWLAGSALEDRYGRVRFALFYTLGAAVAAYSYALAESTPGILLVGASGAVSACMGAFLFHFSKTEINFWYLWMMRSGTFRLPAWFALPFWLAEQFLYQYLHSSSHMAGGVAYAAHIAGFAFGFAGGLAMKMLFPEDTSDGEEAAPARHDEPEPESSDADTALDERIRRCLEAVKARDIATVRTLSSRVILDLARANNDGRILEVYQAIAKQMTKVPLTDGAFAAAAQAADRIATPASYIAIAGTMISEHPASAQTPKVMWRLAQLQGDAGDHALARETLRNLATRFPRDAFGQKAAAELGTDLE